MNADPTRSLERTIYAGRFVHCLDEKTLEICPDGVIGVDSDGKIAWVRRDGIESPPVVEGGEGYGDWESAKARVTRVGGEGFFFPGFIGMLCVVTFLAGVTLNNNPDTHIHAPQYPNAGIFGKSTLLDWLNTYTFPLESSFSDLSQASRIYSRLIARTLSHGTTTACYYATIHVPATNLLATICHTRGQRAFIGRVCMDHADLAPAYYRDASAASSLADTIACIDHVRALDPTFDLISPILTPRFAPSCSLESLHALGRLHAATGIPVQTHLCENEPEIALVRAMFPDARHYADVYDATGLLTAQTILAHCVHLSDEERALIRARDAKVAHCPASNTALTSGCAPVREWLDAGITVGLGTDVSGGHTASILGECREALFVSRHVAMRKGERAKLAVEEALFLATRGGAKVVGLEERIGAFEVGMDWDAQLVMLGRVDREELCQDDGPVDIFGDESWENRIAKWVYTGDDRNTRAVWVKGRLVHQIP
jgi:guanine deaminase